jgi:peptidylprolyl isomerase
VAARSGATLIVATLLWLWAADSPARDEMRWRMIDPANIVHMELQGGTVVLELNPRFAPKTVAQFKRLVREDFYRGLSFYRVIEGFVAQGGDESDVGIPSRQPTIEAEFQIRWNDDLPWTRVEREDLFEAETGFVDGFAAARSDRHVWLTHCPGAVAMARDNDPDSSRTDFYIVIGQAPRYLDRNLSVFARVIHGMDVVQRIRRGPIELNGIIQNDLDRTRIVRMHMLDDIATDQRRDFYVMDTSSEGFRDYMQQRRNRQDEFFSVKPPEVLDVCQVPIGTRVEKADVPETLLNPLLEEGASESAPGSDPEGG